MVVRAVVAVAATGLAFGLAAQAGSAAVAVTVVGCVLAAGAAAATRTGLPPLHRASTALLLVTAAAFLARIVLMLLASHGPWAWAELTPFSSFCLLAVGGWLVAGPGRRSP